MGLDMYLSAKKYMSKHFDHEDSSRIEGINKIFGLEGVEDEDYGAKQVEFRIAYWRKANAIHAWFVDKCQGGVDECQETYISREQLQELLDTCNKILEEPALADELLPCRNGFFFGSTEYDEYYLQDLEYTVSRLERILKDPALTKMEFYYQSSW